MCDYLEIPFTKPDFTRHPNKSATPIIIPDTLKQEIATFHKPVYEFISQRFGEDRIKKLWKSHDLIAW
jgi:hypothetical protein